MRKLNYEALLPYFNGRYDFIRCPKSRLGDLTSFIDKYWKKDHAFVKSRELLDWQFRDATSNLYNIVIAVKKDSGYIEAMVGYVCTSHFDAEIANPVRWGNMWKALPNAEPGLGMMVEWKKNRLSHAVAEVGLGQSRTAIALAKKTGATVGVMEQFFMINSRKTQFSIAQNTDGSRWISEAESDSNKVFDICTLEYYNSIDGDVLKCIPEYKSKNYYVNRYYRHPFYKYEASAICDLSGTVAGVIFWRVCSANGSRCIRIVDYFGAENALSGCKASFEELLVRHDAEYADFLCVGMPQEELLSAGFLNRRENPGWIVPNYFEPFVRDNIDITYSYMQYGEYDGRIFKGDSDQDRPNIIEVQ